MPQMKGFIDIQCENCDNGGCNTPHCRRVINVSHITEIRRGSKDLARIYIDGVWVETEYTMDQLIQKIKAAT